jgi:hypothetical protein
MRMSASERPRRAFHFQNDGVFAGVIGATAVARGLTRFSYCLFHGGEANRRCAKHLVQRSGTYSLHFSHSFSRGHSLLDCHVDRVQF